MGEFVIIQLTSASAFRNFATPKIRNSPGIAKIEGFARFVLQLLHKFWIQLGTSGKKWLQFLRYVGIATGDHASGSVGGFVRRFMLLNDDHAQPAAP